jgi:hypothetical protein
MEILARSAVGGVIQNARIKNATHIRFCAHCFLRNLDRFGGERCAKRWIRNW